MFDLFWGKDIADELFHFFGRGFRQGDNSGFGDQMVMQVIDGFADFFAVSNQDGIIAIAKVVENGNADFDQFTDLFFFLGM